MWPFFVFFFCHCYLKTIPSIWGESERQDWVCHFVAKRRSHQGPHGYDAHTPQLSTLCPMLSCWSMTSKLEPYKLWASDSTNPWEEVGVSGMQERKRLLSFQIGSWLYFVQKSKSKETHKCTDYWRLEITVNNSLLRRVCDSGVGIGQIETPWTSLHKANFSQITYGYGQKKPHNLERLLLKNNSLLFSFFPLSLPGNWVFILYLFIRVVTPISVKLHSLLYLKFSKGDAIYLLLVTAAKDLSMIFTLLHPWVSFVVYLLK